MGAHLGNARKFKDVYKEKNETKMSREVNLSVYVRMKEFSEAIDVVLGGADALCPHFRILDDGVFGSPLSRIHAPGVFVRRCVSPKAALA